MLSTVKTSESSKRNDLLVNLDDDYFWRFWLFDVDQLTKSNEVDDIQVILPEEIYFAHENLRVSMTVDPEVNNLLREFLRTGKNKPSLKTLSRKVVYFVFEDYNLTEVIDYDVAISFAELTKNNFLKLHQKAIDSMNDKKLILPVFHKLKQHNSKRKDNS